MSHDYNAVFGVDQFTINNLIVSVYNVLKPSGLFVQTVTVNEGGISTVKLDISKPFEIDLSAPPHLLPQLKSAIDDNDIPSEDAKQLLAEAEHISLTVTAPSIDVTINYAPGVPSTTIPGCSLSMGALVATNAADNTLRVQVSSALLDTHDTLMNDILNKSAVPYIVKYLNKNIFGPIPVPNLSVRNVTVSLPVPIIQQPCLLAFTALGRNQPDILPSIPSPSNTVFVGVDSALIMAAGNAVLPLGQGESFTWGDFSGGFVAIVGKFSSVQIEPDTSIRPTLTISVNYNITFHTPGPFPNFSWSPSATATITPGASVEIDNGVLVFRFETIEPPTFDFNWGNMGWANKILAPLLDGLADAIGYLAAIAATGLLKGETFNVVDVPAIPVHGYNIILDDVHTSYTPVNGKALLLVQGTPEITSA